MPLSFIQTNFSGGMNLFDADTALADNEYGLAYNIRNRDGTLRCATQPTIDSDAPNGLKQGILSFDDFILLFNNGAAYYKNIVTNSGWTQITDFALLSTVDYIYAEAVPSSRANFARKLQTADQISGGVSELNVNTAPITISSTEAGLVCQDGQSQPYLISSDGTSRKLQTYNEWSLDAREYVPKGTLMKYVNGILFVLAPDGISLLRSVSGRPLDFVVNINIQGNKGGDAYTTAYNAGVYPVTCFSSLNSGEFLVATTKTFHPIEFNYDNTIFAEPTFLNRRTFNVGVVNNFSFIDILGDYCFIDFDGIRSYNAVQALQNEGRNSIFSSRISSALAGIKQTVTASIVFDNYSFFAVNTTYGYVLAVYDNLRQTWVCFDNLNLDGPIKQFAVANQSTAPILYAITAATVYKLYSSVDELEAQIALRAMSSGSGRAGILLNNVYIAFSGNTSDNHSATVTERVDNINLKIIDQDLAADGEVDALNFDFINTATRGWKVQPVITWQGEGAIPIIEVIASAQTEQTQLKQMARIYGS